MPRCYHDANIDSFGSNLQPPNSTRTGRRQPLVNLLRRRHGLHIIIRSAALSDRCRLRHCQLGRKCLWKACGMTLRVIVHAGTHKTGTTAIQQSLQANRTAYAAAGVAVPESVGAGHRSLLVPAHRGWSPDHLLAEIQKATDSHAETLVLSSEAVFCMADEELHALTALIGRDRLTFVMTVRHLSTFLPSRWAQDCRRRDSHSLPQ
ncbi:unannotated protein [freshwater metagenome]|uniref:Unannotated protein n=1 Tax=freshwater metagenome TaxID=449393 RepID=A0A6J7IMH2_9ZZZZ